MRNADKSTRAHQSEPSEGDAFAQMLDGLLAVPRAEIDAAVEADKAAKDKKKVKASSSRAGTSRKR